LSRFPLTPSWRFASVIVLLHAAAAACLAVVVPDWKGTLLGAALLAFGGAAAWSRALLRSPVSVRALEIAADAVTIELTSGERFAAEIGEPRHVSRLMVTLPVRKPARRTILVTRDMLAGDLFRRLRIWALWGRLPGVARKQLAA
jgi:hypothetical protein